MRTILSFLALASMFLACSEKGKVAAVDVDPPAKPVAVAAMPLPLSSLSSPPEAPPAVGGRISGRVLETMNAGDYTYMRLDTGTGEVWTAVRETKVEKGATVVIDTQMVADNFESTTLNRKFDKLIMGVISGEAPPAQMSSAVKHMTSASSVADVNVEKAPGGKTIAETWAGKSALADKQVVIRGRIVKFLPQIMGKNWLHIRDGSGSREQANDDMTVTTDEVAKVGDVVTVSGTLRVDKDFGAGYHYAVIIEDAKLQPDKP